MSPFRPLILIGAACSGTKMLRNALANHPAIDCVPYDVNYIWKMGNESILHDELTPDDVTDSGRARILQHLWRFQRKGSFLIEKTVSNSLRVEFVNRIFPDGRFLHLIRDGSNAVECTYRRWNAPPDWRYLLNKAKTFPLLSAFGYGFRYMVKTLHHRNTSASQGKRVWGVHYKGIQDDLRNHGLHYVCAEQWARCNRRAREALALLPSERVMTVRYEEFVSSPAEWLAAIARFIGVSSGPLIDHATEVTMANVCKGRSAFESQDWAAILPILEPEMQALGYFDSSTVLEQVI